MRGIHFPAGEDYMEETLMSALNYRSVKKVRAGIKHRETCDFVFHPATPGQETSNVWNVNFHIFTSPIMKLF